MRIIISILLIGTAIGAAAFGILGFQGKMSRKPPFELFPDMNRQAKLCPQKLNHFFANGVSSQLPPAGTVARGEPVQTTTGAVYGFEDSPVNTGLVTGTTNFVELNPLPVTDELIQRGRERFDIYCAPCHGKLGDGNGITKKIGVMPAVANLHDKRIVEMTDGEIFNTVTHGKGLMGAAGPLMPTQERWAAIAYLRALQLTWLGSTNDLTAEQKAALK
ncbi:MAG TPA: cytochrome c [Candidatus Limnocylindrales bacterium]|nr:cytochrome c [Candidatus Limnocylindrales bacterium]